MLKKLIARVLGNKTLLNGSIFSAFAFYNQGLSFLILILLAKYILPADYGQLSLYNTFLMFLGYVIALSSHGYESISYFKKSRNKYVEDFSAVLFISVAMFFLLSIVGLLIGSVIGPKLSLTTKLIEIAILTSFTSFLLTMLTDYYRVSEILSKYGVLSCGSATLNFVLSIVLVVTIKMGWEGRVYAHLFTSFLFGIIALLIIVKNHLLTLRFTKDNVWSAIAWGTPLIPHLAAIWIKQGGDRYIINNSYSLEEVGVFSFALNLMNIIMILGIAVNSTNSVSIYSILSSKESSESKRVSLKLQTKRTGSIYLFGSFVIVVMVSVLVPFFLPGYTKSIKYFPILAIAGFLNCIYFIFCNYLFYYGCNKSIMSYTFITAIVHLILSLVCTPISLYLTSVVYVVSQFIVDLLVYKKSISLLKDNINGQTYKVN